MHGNTNRVPENVTPHSTIEDFRTFLENYVKENGIILPGRIPGFESTGV